MFLGKNMLNISGSYYVVGIESAHEINKKSSVP